MGMLPDHELIAAVARGRRRHETAGRVLGVGVFIWSFLLLMLFLFLNDVDIEYQQIDYNGDTGLMAQAGAGVAAFVFFLLAYVVFKLGWRTQWLIIPLLIVVSNALTAFTVGSASATIVLFIVMLVSFAAAYAVLLPTFAWRGMYPFFCRLENVDNDAKLGIHQVVAVHGALPGPWKMDLQPVEQMEPEAARQDKTAPQFFRIELPAPPEYGPGDFVAVSERGQVMVWGTIARRG
nr:Uncharacterised protein [Streptococcus thermophilus]